jgi:hypothetical protein
MKAQAEVLNSTADLANDIIAGWEKRLNDSKIGLATEVRRKISEDERECLSPHLSNCCVGVGLMWQRLKHGLSWSIHVTWASNMDQVPVETTPFNSAKRELRFLALGLLPDLLKKLSEVADKAIAATEPIREGSVNERAWLVQVKLSLLDPGS